MRQFEAVMRVVSPWQPYAGLLYFHLLLDRLTEAGHIEETWEFSAADNAVILNRHGA